MPSCSPKPRIRENFPFESWALLKPRANIPRLFDFFKQLGNGKPKFSRFCPASSKPIFTKDYLGGGPGPHCEFPASKSLTNTEEMFEKFNCFFNPTSYYNNHKLFIKFFKTYTSSFDSASSPSKHI